MSAAIKRLQDPRGLAGRGGDVDDVVRAGILHAVVVRSAYAHARLRGVDVSRAAAHPGVIACLSARDLHPVPTIPIQPGGKPGHAAYLQPPLATDRVRYVGEPVAVIVATDRVLARPRRARRRRPEAGEGAAVSLLYVPRRRHQCPSSPSAC